MDGNHQSVKEIGTKKYNLQIGEVDANAFAMLAMEYIFGLQALFNGIDQEVRQEIFKRAAEIEPLIEF